MKYVWQHISQGDISTAGSSCSKSYLEVMWRKGFFGESGISWDITVSARTSMTHFLTRASHDLSSCGPPANISPNLEIQILEADLFQDLQHVYWMCNQPKSPLLLADMVTYSLNVLWEKLDGVMRFLIYNVLIHKASRHSGVPMRAVWLIPLSNLIIHPRKITLLSDK